LEEIDSIKRKTLFAGRAVLGLGEARGAFGRLKDRSGDPLSITQRYLIGGLIFFPKLCRSLGALLEPF